ncbi:DNA polymerase [Candidatus Bilamarchaeum dharawalense]|uniref:DNA polymerase n=1 Tax=Candidatus Bilamarchaeum dharawalense TaxID=2885759 RepID=A0A5E4LQH9_9ARCH|nr:DNA polymerase [Candidatus Bilamarchaeum dharawalense]
MIRKRAFFIDANYTVKNGKTYVSLLLKGKKTVRMYYQYDPYFYVDAPLDAKNQILAIKAPKKTGEVVGPLRIEECDRNIGLNSKKMLKVYCKEPSHVPAIKAAMPYPSFEYNIPFARRFIFDMQLTPFSSIVYEREGRVITKIISIQPSNPKISAMGFDIETYNPIGTPREQKDPVIMISYCGKKKGVITFKKSSKEFVETVADEKTMLERFFQILKEEDPDVILGYNSANFDLPYLKARATVLGTQLKLGRYGSGIQEVKRGLINGVRVQGRVHFDLYPMAKFFGFIGVIKSQRFTLDAIAEDVLGRKKLKVNKEEIWQMWDSNDIEKLCDYSLVDAELTLALGERFLPIDEELASVAKLPLFDTTISTSGQLVENLLMFHATERKELIPSKPIGDAINERMNAPIQGAFVKLPEPGIYENVAVLDFRGLYPSIIVSYNIDPGTLMESNVDDCFESPTGAKFSKKQTGLIPFVLDYLIDMRMVLKKTIKTLDKGSDEHVRISARSQALKILANSFYGYMGYARSRWYSRQCAESVTAWGRKHIMETIEKAEGAGFQVLYADTDSVFIIYKNKEDVLKFMGDVNTALPSKMELELEGFYPRGVFVSKKGSEEKGAKKKYALLGEDGRIKIRGFELVRRDWSKIAKDTQLKVLEAILKEGSKEKAVKIIREVVTRLNEGKVPLEMLAISTQLNKSPGSYEVASPELSAAKKLLKAGINAEKGTMISYVVGKSGKSISEKAAPIELAKDYDADYYINNQILPAVMKIMKELGYDEHSMKFGGKQKSLDAFF